MSELVDFREIALVIVREGEPLAALVRARVDAEFDERQRLDDLSDEIALREAIVAAVDAWAAAGREGRDALTDSGFDFNLGNLSCAVSAEFGRIASSMSYDEHDLEHHLRKRGIRALAVETDAVADQWVYDTHLFSPLGQRAAEGF